MSSPVLNLSQRQSLFQWVGSLHQVDKVLELQLQHQSVQWIFRTDFLLNWLVWSPYSHRDSQKSSPTPQSWIFFGRTDAEVETLILWPPDVKNWLIWKDWCWERLKVGGEGDDRGWDGWMASPTQSTRVWVNSRRWWWTGRPGMLQFTWLQRVRTRLSDWTGLNWTSQYISIKSSEFSPLYGQTLTSIHDILEKA